MSQVTISEARDRLGDLVSRAEYADERIILVRHGRPVAAIVSVDVLHAFEDLEDQGGLAAAQAAEAEGGSTIPHEQLVAELAAEETRHGAA